ncbi:hypothetical protein DM02DRAFT_679666 [Periconia macrospinosa]|uniref:RlpA-like protein double-psi beta-barrel domain-containing protein n=1 Tax=Periconia macrospinosa TaxID=97972 RepID=A0A2V1E846_9PLEO|nr:hypothetical protein DM02DRAFT_679666 [Periconia macrospinosa]
MLILLRGPKVFNTSADGNLSGDLTYYDPGLGACGQTHTENDAIVAVSHIRFDAAGGANPNNNPLCNKKIRIIRNGHAVDVTVVDRCTGCKQDDLDVSMAVFKSLADVDAGRVSTTWSWL